ncbi:MAG: PD-(D/E)XK nuclease family protein [Longimonas sp.]|uniref:PD-(D/E)XK nuclease family protein n=1 Tax=Longimonas sp. TaxID=2039626 RepID=UPI003356F53D
MADSALPDRSPLIHHLHTLLDAAPGTHTVVFVAQTQLGKALEEAAARIQSSIGLRCTTIAAYARRLAQADLLRAGSQRLPSGIDQMLAAYAVDQLPVQTREQLLQGSTAARLSGSLAQTFSVLRKHGVQPNAYQQALKSAETTTAQQEAQAEAYRHYVDALTENKYYDEADVLQRATELVQEGAVHEPRQSQYAIVDDVDVPGYARALVDALANASPHPLRRLGQEHPTKQAPVLSAAKVFPDAKPPARPEAGPTAQAVHASSRAAAGNGASTLRIPKELHFRTTVGLAEEVRAVFRDIQQRGLPFDQVEIAYTAPDPYLSIVEQQAERHDVPVSLSPGRHLRETRPGQALIAYLDWMAGPQEAAPFIHLLRAGHLTLQRTAGLALSDAEIATWLAERTYQPGATSLLKGVARRIDHAKEQDYATDAQIKQWTRLYESLEGLLGDLPSGPSDIKTVAEHCETFLTQYGPVDKPTGTAETFDEKARGRILQYLNTLQRSEGDVYRDSATRLADYIRTWVRETFVGAQRPQPGDVHVVPLTTVGYANRPHLYVVGMDAESLSVTLNDDPLLSDADRRRLNEHEQITLPLTANRRQEEDWRVRQALLRHHGDATFIMHRFDLRNSEERFPGTLYLQLRTVVQAALGSDPEEHDELTMQDAQHTLDALDAWGLTERALSDAKRGTESASDYLTRTAQHILHGLDAETARASDEVTAYDGVLQDPPYPGLDLLDPDTDTIASASRLEMFARTPYLYFVKYVLEAEPLDEPALDDEDWLDPLTRGTILHRTYELFLNPEDGGIGRMPTLDDEPALMDAFEAAFKEATQQRGTPPNDQVEAAAKEGLRADVRAFLRADAARGADHPDLMPKRFEWSFGNRPRDEHPEVELATGRGTLRLRGAVDRIDALNGELLIWDYKTGGVRNYDPLDGLRNKRWSLQWMLYARAVEEALGGSVARSGYYFATARQMGRTVSYPPDSTGDSHPDTYRQDLNRILNTLSEMARHGVFVPSGDSLKQSDWRYNYTPLVYDRRMRREQIQAKDWPDDRPHLHHD